MSEPLDLPALDEAAGIVVSRMFQRIGTAKG